MFRNMPLGGAEGRFFWKEIFSNKSSHSERSNRAITMWTM